MAADLPRGTVTLLFSDIEGSTELSRRHGAAYGDLRAEHRRLLREALEAHRGHEVDTEGDAFFVVFERATDAVAAAVAAQRALAAADAVRVRMGLHTTEPHLHADGYVGVGVSRAARICAAAHGGQIVLSHATAGVVEDHELPDVRHARPRRSLSEGHPATPAAVPDRRRWSSRPSSRHLAPGPRLGSIATLLSIDLAGWRRVMRELGDDGAAAAAAAYHRIVAETASANDGVEVERVADSAMCVFSSPKDAIARGRQRSGGASDQRLDPGHREAGTTRRSPYRPCHKPGGRPTGIASSPRRSALRFGRAGADTRLPLHAGAILEGELLGELGLRDLGERELPGMTPKRVYELLGSSTSH